LKRDIAELLVESGMRKSGRWEMVNLDGWREASPPYQNELMVGILKDAGVSGVFLIDQGRFSGNQKINSGAYDRFLRIQRQRFWANLDKHYGVDFFERGKSEN
jgi:hypothetical protein